MPGNTAMQDLAARRSWSRSAATIAAALAHGPTWSGRGGAPGDHRRTGRPDGGVAGTGVNSSGRWHHGFLPRLCASLQRYDYLNS